MTDGALAVDRAARLLRSRYLPGDDAAWLRRTRTFVTPETVAYVMPASRSIDIDTADDFEAFRKAAT